MWYNLQKQGISTAHWLGISVTVAAAVISDHHAAVLLLLLLFERLLHLRSLQATIPAKTHRNKLRIVLIIQSHLFNVNDHYQRHFFSPFQVKEKKNIPELRNYQLNNMKMLNLTTEDLPALPDERWPT